MPDKNLRADIWLAKTNKRILTRPAVSSGEERGLLSWTAAGNRAYGQGSNLDPRSGDERTNHEATVPPTELVNCGLNEAKTLIDDWSIDCLIVWSIVWLIDWLIGWLVDWLTDWLIDWLKDTYTPQTKIPRLIS